MTTVQEELEQSTEDIVNATETSLQDINQSVIISKNLTLADSHDNKPSINLPTSNSTEISGCDKDTTTTVQSSKDTSTSNHQTKPQSILKASGNGENQLTVGSTISTTSNATLQPAKYSATVSSNTHIQNPSSMSPTVQATLPTQVAVSTVTTIHESGQVCIVFYLSNDCNGAY